MAKSVEEATRSQSSSNLWFKHRAGRVTASRMKAVCHTNAVHPSQSLIKSICYPEAYSFTSKQTEWGCNHEKTARELYYKQTTLNHVDFEIADSGLVINPKWPYIGASPDGSVKCKCCGGGVLEIKCPYCHRKDTIQSAANEDTNFCLKEQNGLLRLNHGHAYYYQVQTQMFVCDVKYSDFCVCTFGTNADLHVERIYKDDDFWEDCVSKAKLFFTTCLLPELLGNWYTRPRITSAASTNDQSQSTASTNDQPQSAASTNDLSQSAASTNDLSQSAASTNDQPQSAASTNDLSQSAASTNDQPQSAASTNDLSQSAASTNDQPQSTASTNDLSQSAASTSSGEVQNLYCYCRKPEDGCMMIGCDNPNCKIEWYHIKCLKLKHIPKGKWYCPDCQLGKPSKSLKKKGNKQ